MNQDTHCVHLAWLRGDLATITHADVRLCDAKITLAIVKCIESCLTTIPLLSLFGISQVTQEWG
jgi:hypothetical protein